ncbi:uncharacterized protein BDZ99DRAFT_472681 [Mytilinidion resinicola]|uniref:Uncharacterized protein n=1 Tax=Mytilinidion resinicola TaxID=574789 RepID=A0A6A6Z537_9PEZI|nr:uncharacterized protein BDZ99DRAFT_472681 [Mytilinidion resinicola]KAF2815404.1 hypothetical protein BDZ99DRAFT_472681 [Mytilinidion resinicola]
MRSVEPQVIGAVAAVVSAFHGGAELVAQMKKKHKKRKGEQAYKEKQLQESLQSGEIQVETRYAADCRELGEYVKRGDVIARDRLLHIAVVIQAEIIRSLQLAVKYENAILDLTVLHETSIMNRKDTMVTLDELKQRIMMMLPPQRMSPPALDSPSRQTLHSTESLTSSMVPDNYLPPGITIPDQHDPDSKSSLSRFLSTRRTSGKNSTQHSPSNSLSSANFNSGYQFLGPPIQESSMRGRDNRLENHVDIYQDINDTLTSFQGLNIDNTRRDTLGQLQGLPQPRQPPPQFDPTDLSNHPAFTNPPINLADISSHPAFAKSRNNMGNTPSQRFDSPTSLNRIPSTATSSVYSEVNSEPTRNNMGTTFSQPFDANSFGRNDSTSSRSAYSDRIPASVHSHSSHASIGTTGSSGSAFSPRTSATSAPTPTTPVTPDVSQGHFTYSLFPQVPRKGPSPPPLTALPPPPPPPTRGLPSIPTPPAPQVSSPPLSPSPSALQISNPFSPKTPPASSTPTSPSALSISAPFSPNSNTRSPNTFSTGSHISNVPSYGSSNRPSLISTMSNITRSTTSSSSTSTPSTINATNMMAGRPCKQNNYWGFCKGSWGVREEIKKGLSVQTRPEGLYNTVSVWQCKHCLFQGDTFQVAIPGKKKKEVIVDPNIHTSAVGIKYRFIFLAKSHVKRKSSSVISGTGGECSYGCVICCAEGKSTSVFGNVNTLMNHIFNSHAKGMTEEVQRSTKCVVGREPEPGEQWDVCIPFKRFLGDGTAVAE